MIKSPYRGYILFFGAFSVLFLDFITKLFVHVNVPLMEISSPFYPYGGFGVFENIFGVEFSISHRTNTGAAWGIFADYSEWLLVFRIVFIFAIFVYLFFYNADFSRQWPFVLLLSGAIGNVMDFFLYGHVVDMIHFKFWGYDYPVFNVADASIFLGAAWLTLSSCFQKKEGCGGSGG